MTGEPQTAHIEAETDVELWELEGSFLNSISTEHPELLDFLTEIVANRFDTARPIANREISKYIASEIIGRGAFSIVYSGIHAELSMPVTIKMMKHDLAMNPDFLHNFKNEAKIIAKMNHENIVRVYDIEQRFRTVFIIMERLTGMTLDVLLKSIHTLPPQRAACFLIQICKGLRYAHQQGIVHQDIKPANLFLLPDDKIKILDFGLACPVGAENFLTGTPSYMSPEQVRCLPVDYRSDIYSLGLVVFEMLTGRKPFDGDDQWKVMEARANKDVPDPAGLMPSIPEELRKFILKACQRNPSDRYQNIDEVLASLDSFAIDCGLASVEAAKAKRNIKMFYLIYGDDHDTEVKDALKQFNAKIRNMGVELKAAELVDL